MSDATAIPSPVDDWEVLMPTDPEGISVPARAIVAHGPDGRAWADEDVRRFWRRAARTTMRAAFLQHGYTAEVAEDVASRMERAMRGYNGPDQQESAPVPFFHLAWDGAQEGFWQAWNRPQELLDLGEDEAPTLADRQAAVDRARHTRVLYADSLTRPKGAA